MFEAFLESVGDGVAVSGIEVTDLSFRYGKPWILQNFNLSVAPRQLLWLAGPNGIGKSTLLRLTSGLLKPAGGTIKIRERSPEEARVAFVFQDPSASMLPWFSARENIELPLRWSGLPKKHIDCRVESAVTQLSIQFDLSKPTYELSGGEQQLVSIARGVAFQADVFLLDEPFSQLDLHHHLIVEAFLEELTRTGDCAVVLVAHEVETALRIATRCVLLDDHPARVVLDEQLARSSSSVGGIAPEDLDARIRGLYGQ